jgi:hypothetical protein
MVCWTDSVDVTVSLKAGRRIAVDAPAIALAAATAVVGIAQPPKSMPSHR